MKYLATADGQTKEIIADNFDIKEDFIIFYDVIDSKIQNIAAFERATFFSIECIEK